MSAAIKSKNGPRTKSFLDSKENFPKTEVDERKRLYLEEAFHGHPVGPCYNNKTPLESALLCY